MKNMSDGMQAVAGASLRRLIGAVTGNRFAATAVGTLVTCIVQSSSVTTVMVVGFVNSGVMQLTQAVGVIMGANIGTTITGWVLVLNVGKHGLPILGVAAIVHLFSRGDRWRYWAMTIMGIGMVFFGLELMKEACAIIKGMPAFETWFKAFDASNYAGVLKCAIVGCILTTIVQSSSATLGITISLATQGIISYETAAALVLGENIGTTITAFLASLGTTTNARRAAYFHVLFNIVGVIWITLVFQSYIKVIEWMLGVDPRQTLLIDGKETLPHVTSGIAAVHSVFNVVNTLLFMPLVPSCVRFLVWFVPNKGFKEKPRLTDLDILMLETPTLAIEQSHKEIRKMGDGCLKMLDWLHELRQQEEPEKALSDRLKHREQVLDNVQDEIAEFMTKLLSGNIPHAVADEARRQLQLTDEYESLSDYIANLEKFDRKLRRDGLRFNADQRAELDELNQLCREYLVAVNEAMAVSNRTVQIKTEPMSKRIRDAIKQQRKKHLGEISQGSIPPLQTIAFMACLNAYSRVRDHIHGIAEEVSEER
ncbi:MAG: Na/Pi cotransporter family protein [Planctomycetaceae bacterium]|nr:Na/Pi cotransporter family protein [Planctomycetaceae bacterium]